MHSRHYAAWRQHPALLAFGAFAAAGLVLAVAPILSLAPLPDAIRITALVAAITAPFGILLSFWTAFPVVRRLGSSRKRLRESQERLSFILDNLTDMVALLAVERGDRFRIVALNRRYLEAAGRVEEDLVGRLLPEALPEEELRVYLPRLLEAMRTRRPVRFQHELMLNPERYMDTQVTPMFDGSGRCTHILGVSQDLTARRKAEAETERRNRLIQAITDNAGQALFLMDARQHCVFMNPAAEKMIGFTLGELQGRPLHEFIHHTRPDGTPYPVSECPIGMALPRKYRHKGEDVFIRREGGFYPVAFTASPIEEEGKLVGTVVEVQDITESKNSEAHLRERGERLQAALSASDTGTFRWNIRAGTLESDPNLERLFGFRPGSEMLRLADFVGRIHPDDRPRVSASLDRCAREGAEFEMEFRVALPDGSVRWLYDKGKTFVNLRGRPLYMTGACVDITERKLVEDQLRRARQESDENLAQLEAVVRSMSEGLLISGPQGELLFMNPSALAMFDLEGTDRVPRRFQDFPDILEIEDAQGRPLPPRNWPLERVRRGESFSGFEAAIRSRDTGRTWIGNFTGNPVPDGDGRTILFIVTVRDVTQERHTQEALMQQSRLTRTITDNASVGLLLLDPEGRPTFMNPAAVHMLGYTLEETGGMTLHALAHTCRPDGSPYPEEKCAIMRSLASGSTLKDHEDVFLCRDGHCLEVLCSLEPLERDGRMTGAVLEMMDISARRRAETALKESEAKLRQAQKMEAIGQLAGGIAHDFNNLLTAINGYGELSLTLMEKGHPAHDNLREIRKAGERAAALTRQLLAYSRKQMVLPKLLNLNQVVAGMERMLERLIPESIKISTRLDASIGYVLIDPGQLEQVILNLALNARDAMSQGGRLVISTRRVELEKSRPGLLIETPPGPYIELRFGDTGLGMTEETKSRIFEPFYTTKEIGKGTGLGLSSVYGIVQQSGGSLAVDSRPSRGTTFHVYFPEVTDEGDRVPDLPDEALESARGHGERILLVEDEDSVRRFTRRTLEKQGYAVLEARDGEEALHLIRRDGGQLDLLVSDVIMPGMNGPALARKVRSLRPDIKCLFMSGYTEEGILQGLLQEESQFLQKPFSPGQLVHKVRQIMHPALEQDRPRG